jgi:hypothetical protein
MEDSVVRKRCLERKVVAPHTPISVLLERLFWQVLSFSGVLDFLSNQIAPTSSRLVSITESFYRCEKENTIDRVAIFIKGEKDHKQSW